jgi:2-keto-4-pentenoate hydratase
MKITPAGPLLAACLLIGSSAALAQTAAPAKAGSDAEYLQQYTQAEKAGSLFRPVTEMSPGITLPQAYAIQRKVVAQHQAAGDRVVGYKGSLMSQKSLTDRGVKEPLSGTLFASGSVESGTVVSLCGYRRPIIEMKLGFIISKLISRPVASVADLKGAVASVVPVVELPDIAYRDDKTYGAIDMAAANITASKFVRGTPHAVANTDLNAIEASISRGGEVLAKGVGSESLGEQWESLRTVINLLVANGFKIEPGYIVLSGKIGDKANVPPGAYAATFGPLGPVRFDARACG